MTLFDLPDDQATASPVRDARDSVRVRLVVAYDGSGFHGFAVNRGVRTVGGLLTEALQTVLGHPVEITCAGRTDKGVHARAQVVTFDAAAGRVDPVALGKSLNALCGPDVAVTDVALVADDFDARFSATARRYRYRVLNRPAPDPFRSRYAWHVDEELSWPALVLACDALIGEHDFSAFCRRPKRRDGEEASLVRRVVSAEWERAGDDELRFEIEASSFCHQMVRSVVGLLVDVGRGRRHAGEVLGIIRSGDRSRTGNLAPPQGLTLWTVRYPGWDSGP
ncbi:MAG TPA: tRNA pseudouridine(38-40) synthase TruA [Acidimicrobiales bacterium]|nr:tRNA pseudouridine(38-40) synthase TruA [Acidimicrobiales bacterium]HRA34172.1 tRNA pseudouridine(38-40) synthase TruA [Acidimicrobiales bacterium]